MKKFIYTGLLTVFVACQIFAQPQKWEGVLSIGVSNYLGDMVEKRVIPNFNENNLAFGLKFNRLYSKTLNFQINSNHIYHI